VDPITAQEPKEELWNVLQEVWIIIPEKSLNKLQENLSERVQAALISKGIYLYIFHFFLI